MKKKKLRLEDCKYPDVYAVFFRTVRLSRERGPAHHSHQRVKRAGDFSHPQCPKTGLQVDKAQT